MDVSKKQLVVVVAMIIKSIFIDSCVPLKYAFSMTIVRFKKVARVTWVLVKKIHSPSV